MSSGPCANVDVLCLNRGFNYSAKSLDKAIFSNILRLKVRLLGVIPFSVALKYDQKLCRVKRFSMPFRLYLLNNKVKVSFERGREALYP